MSIKECVLESLCYICTLLVATAVMQFSIGGEFASLAQAREPFLEKKRLTLIGLLMEGNCRSSGYRTERAITNVMSSCCSPPVNCWTALYDIFDDYGVRLGVVIGVM